MRPPVIVSRAAVRRAIDPLTIVVPSASRNVTTDAPKPATVPKSIMKKTKPCPSIVMMAKAAFRKPGGVDVSDANIRPPPATRNTGRALALPGPNVGPSPVMRSIQADPTKADPNIESNASNRDTRPELTVCVPNIGPTPSNTNANPDPTGPSPNIRPTPETENRPDPTMPPPGVVIVSRAAKKRPAPLVRGVISRYAIIGTIVPKRRKRKVHLSHIIRNFEPGKSSECEDLNIISMPLEPETGQNETGEPVITNAARHRHRLKLLRRYDLNNPIGVPPQNIRPEFLRSLLTRQKPHRVNVQVVDRRVYQDHTDPNFTGYGTFSFLTACRIFSLIVLGYFMLQYKDS